MTKDFILVCKSVKFYCYKDEEAFFDWANRIACIEKTVKCGKYIYLHLGTDLISDLDLDDLIAFFYRYKVKDMSQLACFLTKDNKSWFFDNKKAFWHKKIFSGAYNKPIEDKS